MINCKIFCKSGPGGSSGTGVSVSVISLLDIWIDWLICCD